METAALHEEASDEWVPVQKPMTMLVGTDAMAAGNLLWLDDGKRLLVGHVNALFGTDAHCTFPCIPVVRAWRRVLDITRLHSLQPDAWATGFDLDEDLFDFVDEDEYPEAAQVAEPMNFISYLDMHGNLQPGLVAGMEDGRVILVGHVNLLAGVCDARVDGSEQGLDHRIARYVRAIPEAVFRPRPYRP